MRPSTVIVNTARGPMVDYAALYDALASGHLRGAMLETFWQEPPPADSPLLRLPNVTLTPHIAGSMGNELHRMASLAVDEVEHLATGTPFRHPVHLDELARMA